MVNRALSTVKKIMMNKEFPICSNCLYFIEHNYSKPCYEDYSRCKKIGVLKNWLTGVIEYDFTRNRRLKDKKCGNLGLEYTNKNLEDVKVR